MKKFKFIAIIMTLILTQSCMGQVSNNVNPSPRYVFFFVKEDRGALQKLYVSTLKDFNNMAFVDKNRDFKADLKDGTDPSMSTVLKDYSKPYYILELVPCDIDGNLDPSYSAVPVAFSAVAIERMYNEMKRAATSYGKPYGVISVSPGNSWVSNICYDLHTGQMPVYDPRLPYQTLGTYYVREQ